MDMRPEYIHNQCSGRATSSFIWGGLPPETEGKLKQVSESTTGAAKAQPPLADFGLEGRRPSRQALATQCHVVSLSS